MSAWSDASTTARKPRPSSKALRSREVEQVLPSMGKRTKIILGIVLGSLGMAGSLETLVLPFLIELPISFGIGSIIVVISYFVLGTIKEKRTVKITNTTSVEMLEAAESKLRCLQNVYMNSSSDSRIFKDVLQEICDSTDKIIDQLIEHPELIFQSRDFLGYYLDTIMTILDGYNKIEDLNEAADQIRKIGNTFKTMSKAYVEKVKNFEKNNLDGLNIEIKLLQDELGQKGIKDA